MATILVADDDRSCRHSIQNTLEREGHVVEGVGDVASALRAVSRHAFDLVVCDYRMPGGTGLDLLAALHESRPGMPVVMVSGYADETTTAAAEALGVSCLLKKPFRRKELLDSVAAGIATELRS